MRDILKNDYSKRRKFMFEKSFPDRFIIALIAFIFTFNFVACDNKTSDNSNNDKQNISQKSKEIVSDSNLNIVTESLKKEKNNQNKNVFDVFEDMLNKNGITFEKVQMASSLIGAEQGIKYKIEEGKIELYKFDKSSEAYIKAESNQTIILEIGTFDAVVENGMAIIITGLEEDIYLDFFRNL